MRLDLFTELVEYPAVDGVEISAREFAEAWPNAFVGKGSAYFRPFAWGGELYAMAGFTFPASWDTERRDSAEAYRLIETATLDGLPLSLGDKFVRDNRLASDDPLGMYHGVGLQYDGRCYVMAGRPRVFYKAPERRRRKR